MRRRMWVQDGVDDVDSRADDGDDDQESLMVRVMMATTNRW